MPAELEKRMANDELRDLVEAPRERMDVEYKSWPDTSDKRVRGELARHLCALANHGGGYIVFRINDDMTSAGPAPDPASKYDQDTISGIVDRYLSPSFQVAVYRVTSGITGLEHPVVWIPSHDTVPVASMRDGPQANGKPVEISQQVHYTRAPGPKSVPVTTSDLWAPIIRRCVLHDRMTLLGVLAPILRSPQSLVSAPNDPLKQWHEAAQVRFMELAVNDPLADQLKTANYQFSYSLQAASLVALSIDTLLSALRDASHAVKDLVDPGWSMFHVFDRHEISPYSETDSASGEREFLECSHIRRSVLDLALPDFWRVSPTGKATIIRPYREDRRQLHGKPPGTYFSPFTMARELTEIVRHAQAMAEHFEAIQSVSFRVEWSGLKQRELNPGENWSPGRIARTDRRLVTLEATIADLKVQWPELVSEMLSQVMRVFHPSLSISAERVREWTPRFRY